jgi:small subunit ribosomal protein S3
MGQKVHPHGFRIGYLYGWESHWYADKHYTALLHEDLAVRRTIARMLPDAGVARVEIDRNANQVTVTIHTARPGIVIGRGGQRVDELRGELERLAGRRMRVNIVEIRMPEVDAALVARSVADQLERRISHRRAMKQAVARAVQRGALGMKIKVSGRLGGGEMSRKDKEMVGRVPLHTLRADIDYGTAEARTTLGRIGVKVWVYKGDIRFEPEERERPEEEEHSAPSPPPGPAPSPTPAPAPAE